MAGPRSWRCLDFVLRRPALVEQRPRNDGNWSHRRCRNLRHRSRSGTNRQWPLTHFCVPWAKSTATLARTTGSPDGSRTEPQTQLRMPRALIHRRNPTSSLRIVQQGAEERHADHGWRASSPLFPCLCRSRAKSVDYDHVNVRKSTQALSPVF